MSKQKVIVILGQTASGKSALAVKIALRINGEIVSADSRQVYKGLDIGTGKITKKEMKGVLHHMLDIANPKVRFTATQYKSLAEKCITEVVARKKVPIICGGTGFYIDAITKGANFPKVPPNMRLRKKLEILTLDELFKKLKKLDRRRAENIDVKNKVRLIRAIEIAQKLGKVPDLVLRPPSYEFIKIGLYLPHDKLVKRINKRVREMFTLGLSKEIDKLKKSGVSDKRLRELGFEYNKPTEEKVIARTIKYAKRQMTWFKRDEEIKWFDASRLKFVARVMKFLGII